MIAPVTLIFFAGSLLAQQTDWTAAGNRALDNGSPEEAAADFAQALAEQVRAGASMKDLLHLRVTLATAYLEAGEYRKMQTVLEQAQEGTRQVTDGRSRAELLNAWSALHMKLGQLPAAEAELQEAQRIVMKMTDAGDLLPTVLHNLAGVEMRTGRYADALGNEREAMRRFETLLAPDHPTLIRGWASLASLEYMMGQPQKARTSIERAIASAEKTYGSTHPLVADLLESAAIVFDKLKLAKEAKRARGRARKIRGTAGSRREDPLIWSLREASAPDGQVQLRSR